MISNYLKVALRNILKHVGYSLVNVLGLAIGMTCCLLIYLYTDHELSYDNYHPDVDRSHRIVVDIRTQTANRVFSMISPPVAPVLRDNFPQVETVARVLTTGSRLVKRDEVVFYEDRFMYADKELFEIFSMPFLKGDSGTALERPAAVVISERVAQKYFGEADPMGRTLNINTRDYEVSGVIQDSPENTHMKYDLIASMTTLKDWGEMTNWHSTMFHTYLKLKPNVDVEEFSNQVANLADPYVKELLDEWGTRYNYFLQPLPDIHLFSHLRYEIEPAGNPLYVYIFSAVGLFILLIAGINFTNLATARSVKRAKEVGLRKVVGAQRCQLIGQFLGESLLMAVFAFILALGLARLVLPLLNSLSGVNLSYSHLFQGGIFFVMLATVLVVGFLAGIYPAFVLSSYRPVATLKGVVQSGVQRSFLRKAMVVLQFSISLVLIIGTLIIYQQLRFMKDQPLGFDKEQKLVLPLRGGINIRENYESVKKRFLDHPAVQGATVSSTVPGREVSNFAITLVGEEDDKNQSMFHIFFDSDFISGFGIEIVAGRGFQKDMSTDVQGAFLINEAAVKAFGWSEPEQALGKRLRTGFGGRVSPVIGVVKDFHYRGLQVQVEPLVMENNPDVFRNITLTLDTQDLASSLAFVESTWQEVFPENPYEQFFLDTDFERQYRSDERIGRIFGVFTSLGLFIACLGLLGLAAFAAEQRTKEIGIRKVMGASAAGIFLLFAKDFMKWIIVANLIAWPVAYLAADRWLSNFAYKTSLHLWVFLLSAVAVLTIALFTVSYQSLKAAVTDPVHSLRYE
jgi:putative ABC transport system permease protein